MRLRPDFLIFGIIVALSAYVVIWQTNSPTVMRAYRMGERVEDFALPDIEGKTRRLSDEKWHGKVATVLYFWSVECPCVDMIEHRMKSVYSDFPEERGFQYVAIDADPEDDAPEVLAKMARLYAFYRMMLDPKQTTAARLGGTSAGQVVVLDKDLRIRYRGAIDDDFKKPQRFYLKEVLRALEQGKPVPAPLETPGYGCPFPGIEGICSSENAPQS